MILVLGGAGYIGSHCVLALLRSGYDVLVFDNLSTGNLKAVNVFREIETKGKFIDFVEGDLTDFESISAVFKTYKIDAVMHFAAFSQAEESVIKPYKYYKNNVLGALNLFGAMIENKVSQIIFSSTAAIYGEAKYIPINEEHPKDPINPYGKTKLIIENILTDYDSAYGLKSICLRYFNVVGADTKVLTGESHNPETHLVPNVLKSSFDEKKTFYIYGDDYDTKDGTCIRDYVNVEDLADAHLKALEYLSEKNQSDFFNIGTKNGNSVKEVFEICEKVTGKKLAVEIKDKRCGDCAVLLADNKKAQNVLGWQPTRTLEDSIETAYSWEKSCIDKACNEV